MRRADTASDHAGEAVMAKADEIKRLGETRILAGMLADRMMAAYVVGGKPNEAEVRALCAAVLLLEEHGLALPLYAEDVIARLAAEEEGGRQASPPAVMAAAARRRPLDAFGRALRSLRPRMAA